MTKVTQNEDVSRPRIRSRDEMDATYRQIIASSPEEGPRLVEVHKQLVAKLDEMIESSSRTR